MKATAETVISDQFCDNLRQIGATDQHIDALSNPETEHRENGSVNFVFLEGGDETIYYVPGFSENPISNAPFGVTLANQGYDVALLGHYDGPVEPGPDGKPDAMSTRASYYTSIVNRGGAADRKRHYVTHSMGNLTVQKMAEKAVDEESDIFEGATIVMLAPSGISANENLFKLGYRNSKNIKNEKARGPQEFNDTTGEMEKSCFDYMKSKPGRTMREVRELARKSGFDPAPFAHAGVARVALIGYAADVMYSDEQICDAFYQFDDVGVDIRYATPVKLDLPHSTATHNDEQSNPSRVSPVVAHFFKKA